MTNKTNSQEMNGRTAYSGSSEQVKGGNWKMNLKKLLVNGALITGLAAGTVWLGKGCYSFLERPTFTAEIDGAKLTYSCRRDAFTDQYNTLSVEIDGQRYEFSDRDTADDSCDNFRHGDFNRSAAVDEVVIETQGQERKFFRETNKFEESIFEQADRSYNSLREKLYEKLKTEAQGKAQEIADNIPK